MTDTTPILSVHGMSKRYPVGRTLLQRQPRYVHALDSVSFEVGRGEILGLVGESGSGKTTTALCVLGLIEPSEGEIVFDDKPLRDWLRPGERLAFRRRAQMIFQDPYEALNPRQTIYQIIAEPLEIHGLAHGRDKTSRVAAALRDVGLNPPEQYFHRYPQELSGGQRQRVVIAGALVLDPLLLVADEPVSMLDVSIRADILTLLHDLRARRGISILYITHDLATARYFTDRIAVMYLGRIVELGATAEVIQNPRHPYTRALVSVVPAPNPRRRRKREIIQGEVPNPIDLPSGCRFHPRCPDAVALCRQIDPPLSPVGGGHRAACILVNPVSESESP